ncbi:DUF1845 domain-containing protein [Vibrio vulnificus]|uniref:DUF1845 domain-containing protein n=1 Tax=Vibrio vulnificus TaxID=672 RepID=UPI00165E7191|nr:DUF1845 domain-containing protein [Vibrio vulnificus]
MELRTKRLLSLWDHKTYTNRARPLEKPIDGLFVYQSLFSVEAFASRPTQNVTTKLAKATADSLLEKIRTLRDDINLRHRNFINTVGELDINTYSSQEFQEVDTEQRLFTPGSVMLMKVFMAADRYFNTLYKARLNGELTETEFNQLRNKMTKEITRNLNQLNMTCLSFHKVRKEAENVS